MNEFDEFVLQMCNKTQGYRGTYNSLTDSSCRYATNLKPTGRRITMNGSDEFVLQMCNKITERQAKGEYLGGSKSSDMCEMYNEVLSYY
jgi:hypothetical protein